MNDMIGWLRQQLDTDEAEADADASPPPGYYDAVRVARGVKQLAVVQAHRAILDAYEAEDNADRYGGCGDDCEWKALRYAIKQIVSIYSDRDDYRAEWAS